MTNFRSAALFVVSVVLLASLTGSLRAAPDNTLGAALMFAVVSLTGEIERGSGATSTSPGALAGQRIVFIDRDVTGCAYTASTGSSGTGSSQGIADVASASGFPNGVRVDTRDFDGNLSGRPFHLIVLCAR
jgi:hypothetical protein